MKNKLVAETQRVRNIPQGIIVQSDSNLYIDPMKIHLHSRPEFESLQNTKIYQVRDGDWDLNYAPHDKEDFYISLKQFIKTGQWENTPHYKRVIKEIASGKAKWGCTTEEQFKQYLNNIIKIFDFIKESGYVDVNPNDRIEVNISRDGKYLLNTGRHRLAFAKILGIEKVPVNINTIHSSLASERLLDTDYDLFNKRKNIMEKYVDIDWSIFSKKTVLDIGPAFGIWSVLSHCHGALVEAIDIDKEYMRIFTKISKMLLGYNIPIKTQNILDLTQNKKYDIVFFMAVWHHIPNKKDCLKALDKIFSIAKERLILEGPVGHGESKFEKQQKGPAEHHNFYWIPSVSEIKHEIKLRGGRIEKIRFSEGKNRVFMEVNV